MSPRETGRPAWKTLGFPVATLYAVVLGLSVLSAGPLVEPWAPVLFYAGLAVAVAAALVGAALGRATMIGTPFWQRHGGERPPDAEERLRHLGERWQRAVLMVFVLGLALMALSLLLWQLPF